MAAALVCAITLPAAMAVDAATATFRSPWGRGRIGRIDIYDPLSPTLQSFAVLGADSGKVTTHYNSVYFSGNIKVPMDASAPYLESLGLTAPFLAICSELASTDKSRLVSTLAANGVNNTTNSGTQTMFTWIFSKRHLAASLTLPMGLHCAATSETRYAQVSAPAVAAANEAFSLSCPSIAQPNQLSISATIDVRGSSTQQDVLVVTLSLD